MKYLFLILLTLPSPVFANDWDALRAPDAIAIMRHALAPGGGDPAGHTIDDCTTQRNLSAAGRAQARRTGEALRAQGITFDSIYTSQWCRTRDTASLLDMGAPMDAPALNSFFGRNHLREEQTDALRALLSQAKGRNMLVTHQVNIAALAGSSTRSGKVIVFRLAPDGVEILGRILIDP